MALIGLDGIPVDIETDIASGLPRFAVVGLPDRALVEAADRVRSAIVNSGLMMPSQRVTVNLSPAALPKAGTGFDLGIAVATLIASRQIPTHEVAKCIHIGELALDGRLRPTAGILPIVLGAKRAGASTIVVPAGNAEEARLVEGVHIVALSSLREVAIWHGAALEHHDVETVRSSYDDVAESLTGDLADVVGNRTAVDALVIAAAGGHHLSMVGSPGAGKTMLASRLVGILPNLTPEQAVEVACVQSVAGGRPIQVLPERPPLETPHHTASTTSMVGGGTGLIRPGSIARAAHGVLFLDEAPEFSSHTLDALRQPLESGNITIHRANLTATFPARFQLVLASNPCPCGNYGTKGVKCECAPMAIRRYGAKLSGPLRDRIDINLMVPRVRSMVPDGESALVTTQVARERVVQARAIAAQRWAQTGVQLNTHVPGPILRNTRFRLPTSVTSALDVALSKSLITARGYDRTLRLAWTLSDLDGTTVPSLDHVGRALVLRRGSFE
jgi:magnesium chelatase family protein